MKFPADSTGSFGHGRVVGGRYEIRRPLAIGGEAKIYLAHDQELDLDVVLKTRPIRGTDQLDQLRREAALLMRVVAHPGLPTVRSDVVEDDHYSMISDYVDGRDLHDHVRAQSSVGLALPSVLDLIDQLASTLDHLHTQNTAVIHGDVKPENVVVTSDGRAVLVDFGAAMRVGDERERLGTPGFSAPEVLAGDAVSAASDVYSLAALTVYLLTGLTPKLGIAWAAAIADGNLARLERVIRRGLTWDPLGRPWTATEFARDLRRTAETEVPTGTVTLLLLTPRPKSDQPSMQLLTSFETAGGRQIASATTPANRWLFVYSRAGDAAAAALQYELGHQMRIALHAGDLGGRHGATLQQLVNEIVALGDAVPDIDMVCSAPVRMLLGGDPALSFHQASADAVELRRRNTSDGQQESPGPGARFDSGHAQRWIATRRTTALVGRNDQVEQAMLALDRSRADAQAALVVVTGEPGIGKSRFLAEIAAGASDAGELVLVGRCTESGGAFEVLLDALGDGLFPFESGLLERDEEGWIDRRRFFGRIASAIRDEGRAVTLILDDVQWIDGSSLALLTQLLDDVGPTLAVVAGSRHGSEAAILEQLAARPEALNIAMRPLSVEAFVDLSEQLGVEVAPSDVSGLYALTRGNPFFGLQLLEQLRRSPDRDLGQGGLSVGARDWILHRVDLLGDNVASTLSTAAVVGRTFDVIVLADVLGISPLDALARLDVGHDAGFLVDGERPGEFSFVHAIVQATLAASLSETRRQLLHAAVARRLEENGDTLEQLEAATHHWLAAGRLGDPLHAGDIAAVVGTRATERLAHERAVSILDRALAVISLATATVARDRVEARLRVAHGRANFVATRNDEALTQLYRAADLAERADDPETLVQAALVASLNRRHGLDDSELLRLLDRASERCPPEPAVLRAMLHIRRSRLLPISVPHEDRSEMARLGLIDVALMEPVDRAMVETEVARACWVPDDVDQRLSTTTRIIDVAMDHVDGGPSRWTGVLIEALNLRWAARVQVGDLRSALADAVHAVKVADDAGTTFLLSRSMMGEAMIRATLGELERAERLAHNAIAISSRHNLTIVQMAIAYGIGRDRGQQEQLAQLERQFSDRVESNPLFVAAFALVHAEANQLDDAHRLLDELELRQPWARNWIWLATTAAALETAVLARHHELVERYTADLLPFTGQWAIAAAELCCWGPVDRVLGLAARSTGDIETARAFLISARDSALANGAEYWTARCNVDLADSGGSVS